MSTDQSIIIKRVKKVAGGHHGGAWKVAYADFVTAMMAFFLLLWLLNATEAENLAGLADYFAPTVGVKDQMGIGFRGGKAALSEGIGADKNTNKGIVFGGVPTGPITKVTTQIEERTEQPSQEQIQVMINETDTQKKGTVDNQEDKAGSDNPAQPSQAEQKPEDESAEEIEKTQQALETSIDDMVKNKRIDEGTVTIKRTPEGLLIEIKDVNGNSMFEKDSMVMKPKLKEALVQLSKILKNIPNNYAIIGHTSSAPVESKKQGYSKWELSSDRANATRIFLEKNGVQAEQFSRIEGRADNVPADTSKPEANINNRINIIILTKSDTPEHKRSAPDSLLLDMQGEKSKQFIEETEKPKVEEKKDTPANDNQDIKKILDESAATRNNANRAAPEVPESAEMIDLGTGKKEVAPVAPAKTQINENAQKIFQESEKIQSGNITDIGTGKNAVGKFAPTVNSGSMGIGERPDIIDLGNPYSRAVTPLQKLPEQKNKEFQNIIDDINELKKQKAPVPPAQQNH